MAKNQQHEPRPMEPNPPSATGRVERPAPDSGMSTRTNAPVAQRDEPTNPQRPGKPQGQAFYLVATGRVVQVRDGYSLEDRMLDIGEEPVAISKRRSSDFDGDTDVRMFTKESDAREWSDRRKADQQMTRDMRAAQQQPKQEGQQPPPQLKDPAEQPAVYPPTPPSSNPSTTNPNTIKAPPPPDDR